MATTSASLRPTRLVFDETDAQVLSEHSLLIILTPTVSSVDRSEFIGLSAAGLGKLYVNYEDILEGVLKPPQIHDHDQFLVLFHKDEGSLSRRISLGQVTIELDFEGKKGNYLRTCKTLVELKMEQIDLYNVLIQNIESCVLKGEPKESTMQWSPNMKFIRTSTPNPKPTPLKPNPNPSPSPSMCSLFQEIGKQWSQSFQVLLAAFQLEASKRGFIPLSNPNSQTPTSGGIGSTPKDKPPNGKPPNNNTPNLPKSNDSILDPGKLGETLAKANENVVEIIASQGYWRLRPIILASLEGMS